MFYYYLFHKSYSSFNNLFLTNMIQPCIMWRFFYLVSLLLLSCVSRVRLCVTHRRQPSRLPLPWDSPGKNTGVGCISFSNAWKWKVKVKLLSCLTQRPHGLQPTRLLRPWDFPGKSTGMGCHCLVSLVYFKLEVS